MSSKVTVIPKAGCRRGSRFGWRLLAGAAVLAIAGAVSIAHALPFPEARMTERRAGGSPCLLDREGRPFDWRVGEDGHWRLPADVDAVSPWVVRATVAVEDNRFWSHPGVDLAAMARAAVQNATNGKRISGASTLPMQTIRLLWPRERTYAAKVRESWLAWKLDRATPKEEILEAYLDLAPYGGNVTGIEAASRRFFGKPAADLSLGEAALLAGVPQSPSRLNPAKRLDAALRRREAVFRRMAELGLAESGDIEKARKAPLELRAPPRRADASRFADFVLSSCRGLRGLQRTTLDPRAQDAAAAVVAAHARPLREMGVDGFAAVVVDAGTSELLAMVGSADPSDPLHGKVNAAASRRQPGSMLKPFLFAAAFDAGLLTPSSLVEDEAGNWGGYRPENMDREFRGPIPAWQALRESRNLPAVRLLERIGPGRFAADLDRLGLGVPGAGERCGLSLALGTAEVRLVDLANAYAALARLGEHRPLRVLAGLPPDSPSRVFSPGAAYLALRALGAPGPGEPGRPVFKTGTSWNHRDAWAAALTPERVVAVWCGRMSGEGHPALTGARAALPAALEILERLSGEHIPVWGPPPGVRTRLACARSGAPPSVLCTDVVSAEFLPGKSPDLPCALCGRTALPPAAAPAAFDGATESPAGKTKTERIRSLEIVSPPDGAEYRMPKEGSSGEIEFRVRGLPPGARIAWFLDGELFASSPAGEGIRWILTPGRHELSAADGSGAFNAVKFTVFPTLGR